MSGETLYFLLCWTQGWYAHEVVEIIERGGGKHPAVGAVSLGDPTQTTKWYAHGYIDGLPEKLDPNAHEFRIMKHHQVIGLIMTGHPITVIEKEKPDALPA